MKNKWVQAVWFLRDDTRNVRNAEYLLGIGGGVFVWSCLLLFLQYYAFFDLSIACIIGVIIGVVSMALSRIVLKRYNEEKTE